MNEILYESRDFKISYRQLREIKKLRDIINKSRDCLEISQKFLEMPKYNYHAKIQTRFRLYILTAFIEKYLTIGNVTK